MKRVFLLVSLLALMVTPLTASAKLNRFYTAQSLTAGKIESGVFVSLSDEFQVIYPRVRYGLGYLSEVGIQAGVVSHERGGSDDIGAFLGADFKYQLIKETEKIPLDLALDAGFNLFFLEGDSIEEWTFALLISRLFEVEETGYTVSPYGGFELSNISGSYVGDSFSDTFFILGLDWRITEKFSTILDVKTGDYTVGGLGLRIFY